MSMVFTDAMVTINGTTDDISDFVKSVTIEASRSDHDDTTMGAAGKTHKAGMVDGSVSLELTDDYAASGLDSKIWAAFNAGSNIAMRVRTTSAAIGTGNPEFRFEVTPTAFTAGGAVDELATKSISWPISGGITRHTS